MMSFHHLWMLEQPEKSKSLKTLSSLYVEQGAAFQRITGLIAKTLSVPVVILSIIDSEGHWILCQVSQAEAVNETIALRFCEQVIAADGLCLIANREQPILNGFDEAPLAQMQMMSGAGFALVAESGHILGTLCVFDDEPRPWTELTVDCLRDFSRCIVNDIELSAQRADYQLVKNKLEQERDLLRALIDTSPDYIFVKDTEGRFVISNKAHARAAKVDDPNALVGKTASETFSTPLATQFEIDDRLVLESGQSLLNLERQTVDHEDNPIWVLTSKIPFMSRDEKILGLVGISRDITTRKQAEESIRERELFIEQILMTSPGFVYVYSLEHQRNLYSNNGIASVAGYTPDEIKAMGSEVLRNLMHTDDFPLLIPHFERVMQLRDGEGAELEYRLRHKNGSYIWIHARDVIFKRSEDGTPIQTIGVGMDTTRMKAAEERVRALEQIKTDMIRVAAHDLRSPLTSVSGYLQLLKGSIDDPLNPQQEVYFEMLAKSLGTMHRIITDILSLERIESMNQQAEYATIDISQLVSSVFEDNHSDADHHRLDYQFTLPTASIYVRADEAQLREAIDNVISNAIKYTPDGGEVRVRLSCINKNAQLEIADNGYGIPEAMQARLFQPFFRAKTAQTRHIEGTGLGLHLVKNIVERHSGHIYFQSKVGKGSIFTIELPLLESMPTS